MIVKAGCRLKARPKPKNKTKGRKKHIMLLTKEITCQNVHSSGDGRMKRQQHTVNRKFKNLKKLHIINKIAHKQKGSHN